ncbi:hypothetical protein X759_21250 [Mesorhizobium sp. LSHC420B00]|nr:hypothetical protein X759_21250 [Mesorhizobium sp. LSHC420B00]
MWCTFRHLARLAELEPTETAITLDYGKKCIPR